MCRECNDIFICEVCGVEGDHKYHELLNLRPVVVEIMKNFEENFTSFQHEFTKVQQSRVSDYRATIYQEMDDFFERIHSIVEEVRKQKQIEVEEVFRKLKIDDLSDLDKY